MKIKWTRFDRVSVASPNGIAIPNFTPCIYEATIQAGQMEVRGDNAVEINADGLKEGPKDRFCFTDSNGITYLGIPSDLFAR